MGAATSGLTPDRIQKHYRVPKSSTIRIVQNALVRHTGDSKSRSGGPKKLSIRDERYILRIVRRDPKITYKISQRRPVSLFRTILSIDY